MMDIDENRALIGVGSFHMALALIRISLSLSLQIRFKMVFGEKFLKK